MLNDYRIAYGIGFTAMRYFNASGADLDGEYGEDRSVESHLIPLAFHTAVGAGKNCWSMVMIGQQRMAVVSGITSMLKILLRPMSWLWKIIKPNVGNFYNIGSNSGALGDRNH